LGALDLEASEGLIPLVVTTPISTLPSSEKSFFSHTRADSSSPIESPGSATTKFKDVLHTDFMGSGVDIKFDKTLRSLGIIVLKHSEQFVANSILHLRRTQIESLSPNLISSHMLNRMLFYSTTYIVLSNIICSI